MQPTRSQKFAALLLLLIRISDVWGGGLPGIVPSGVATTTIVHAANDDDKEFGALWVALRQGDAAKHFSEGGRRLTILDDAAEDETGKKVVSPEDLQGVTLPAALFKDPSRKIVAKESIPKGTTAQSFVEMAGRHGG